MLAHFAAAVLSLAAAPAHPTTHLRGCRSSSCDRRVRAMLRRRYPPPMRPGVASWYDDAGGLACSGRAAVGVAHRTLPCGTRVQLCYVGCETATVDDRGPFIAGRDWDLDAAAKAGIGCSDLCHLRWRIKR